MHFSLLFFEHQYLINSDLVNHVSDCICMFHFIKSRKIICKNNIKISRFLS